MRISTTFIDFLPVLALAIAVPVRADSATIWHKSREAAFSAWHKAHQGTDRKIAILKVRTLRLADAYTSQTHVITDPPVALRVPGMPEQIWDQADAPIMTVVPAGAYTMGSPDNEPNRNNNEGPQRRVTIRYPFAVSTYPITRDEYAAFVAATNYPDQPSCYGFQGEKFIEIKGRNWRNPGFDQTGRHPVTCIGRNDALAYAKWLSKRTGHRYRLLTGAEYEYVRRGGTTTSYWWGADVRAACSHANGGDETVKPYVPADRIMNTCSDGFAFTAPVGSFTPNPFGLYDISGNVWSWVEDCYSETHATAPIDGSADRSGNCNLGAVRGGSWIGNPYYLRSARRYGPGLDYRDNSFGIRLARTL